MKIIACLVLGLALRGSAPALATTNGVHGSTYNPAKSMKAYQQSEKKQQKKTQRSQEKAQKKLQKQRGRGR